MGERRRDSGDGLLSPSSPLLENPVELVAVELVDRLFAAVGVDEQARTVGHCADLRRGYAAGAEALHHGRPVAAGDQKRAPRAQPQRIKPERSTDGSPRLSTREAL